MISPEIAQLVVEIMERIGEREKREAEAEPEVCLVALLQRIKLRIRDRSSMLQSTVEFSFFNSHRDEARKFLESQQTITPERREG